MNEQVLTELSDREAYALLKSLGYPKSESDGASRLGEKFRASGGFLTGGEEIDGWKLPREEIRLPVDSFIRELLAKNSEPRIAGRAEHKNSIVLREGPYGLVRSHLWHFVTSTPDFAWEAAEARVRKEVVEIMEDASHQLIRVLTLSPSAFARRAAVEETWASYMEFDQTRSYQKVRKHRETLKSALESLDALMKMSQTELELTWSHKAKFGRKTIQWKKYYVRAMGHLWWLLTGTKPSTDSTSLFSEFVETCWISLDERMPEVSFTRAIQTHRT